MIKLIQKCIITSMFAIPAIGFMVTPNDYVIKGENRMINKMPLMGNVQYFSKFVNWYNDRLLFKIPTTENLYANFHEVFNDFNFSSSQFTIEGNEGWLFVGDSVSKAYSQHNRELNLNPDLMTDKLNILNSIRQASNAKFFLVIGPDKHGIYPEYMKKYIYQDDKQCTQPGKYRFFNKIRKYLEEQNITVIDNYDVLRAAKDTTGKHSLYYTDDTHWNRAGAHVAFENVMSQILDDFKPIEYKFSFSKHINGDLIRNIKNPKKDILDDAIIDNPRLEDVIVTNLYNNTTKFYKFNSNNVDDFGSKYINNNAIEDKKVLLITDSYGIFFTPYAVDYFKEVIHLNRQLDDIREYINLIKKEQPNIILFINVEKTITNL